MLTIAPFLFALHFAGAEIPPYIKICHRDDPNVDKCIMNSIEELRPKLIKVIIVYKGSSQYEKYEENQNR
ncbi:unnamed protein product [Colias eurytheme]|nr:unnamed protein product [Colias eurytheme]